MRSEMATRHWRSSPTMSPCRTGDGAAREGLAARGCATPLPRRSPHGAGRGAEGTGSTSASTSLERDRSLVTTTIILSAYPGRRTVAEGYSTTEIRMSLSDAPPRRRLTVAGLDGIARAVAEFGRDVQAANPGASFSISVSLPKGQRKPRGFDEAEKAGMFGDHAFLQTGVEDNAFYRRLVDPAAPAGQGAGG